MLEHNIAMSEVESSAVGGDEWTREDVFTGKKLPWTASFVSPIIEEFFFVRYVNISRWVPGAGNQRIVQFFGNTENVAIAKYAYVYLSRTFNDLWKAYKKRTLASQRDCRSYYEGLAAGFTRKLRAERRETVREKEASENALIRVNEKVETAFREAFPDVRLVGPNPTNGSIAAMVDGVRDGRKISLHKPLPEPVRTPRGLPAPV